MILYHMLHSFDSGVYYICVIVKLPTIAFYHSLTSLILLTSCLDVTLPGPITPCAALKRKILWLERWNLVCIYSLITEYIKLSFSHRVINNLQVHCRSFSNRVSLTLTVCCCHYSSSNTFLRQQGSLCFNDLHLLLGTQESEWCILLQIDSES